MKKTDPGLEHIRQVRHKISAEHQHDPKKLVEHYEKLQTKYADRLLDPAATDEASTRSK